MKHYFLLIVIALAFSSCNNSPKNNFIGVWKQSWDTGQESDDTDNDIFKVQLTTDDSIILKCINYNYYIFDRVHFDGKELSFRVENTDSPEGKFYINYKLKLNEDGKWMDGLVNNSLHDTYHIKWEKIN
jgi:hypothetical protein